MTFLRLPLFLTLLSLSACVPTGAPRYEITYERIEKVYPTELAAVDATVCPITLITLEHSPPNSADGVDLTIAYLHRGSGTIKYLDWSVEAYNAVNDKVTCHIRRRSEAHVRVVGPEKPFDQEVLVRTSSHGGRSLVGGITWKNQWYSSVIDHLVITELTITYMDGSTKSYKQVPVFVLPQPSEPSAATKP